MTTMPVYATREEIKAELDVRETARSSARIDRVLDDASRRIEGQMHRRFYPEQATRYFDWPPRTGMTPWILRLDDNELISVTTLVSGGTTISASDYFLRRADNRDEAPYTRLEISLSTSAAFGGGSTYQRDITVTGLWGYRNDEATAGALAAAVSSTTAATITVDGAASAALGVGSILRVDDERMIVTERAMLDTGQGFGDSMTASAADVSIGAADGTAYTVGETILRDSERMLITDIAGNTLTVARAWDGTVLAAHTDSAIYAPRTLTVTRGALGTTAATHANAASVYRWVPPGGIRQLCVAETVTDLLQGRSGYARTAGTGESEREVYARGLTHLRDSTYQAYGRKARVRSI